MGSNYKQKRKEFMTLEKGIQKAQSKASDLYDEQKVMMTEFFQEHWDKLLDKRKEKAIRDYIQLTSPEEVDLPIEWIRENHPNLLVVEVDLERSEDENSWVEGMRWGHASNSNYYTFVVIENPTVYLRKRKHDNALLDWGKEEENELYSENSK